MSEIQKAIQEYGIVDMLCVLAEEYGVPYIAVISELARMAPKERLGPPSKHFSSMSDDERRAFMQSVYRDVMADFDAAKEEAMLEKLEGW